MNILALILDGKPAGEIPLRASIAKNLALLCLEPTCEAIYEAGGGGPGVPDNCPRCGGRESWPIARGLDRKPEEVTTT